MLAGGWINEIFYDTASWPNSWLLVQSGFNLHRNAQQVVRRESAETGACRPAERSMIRGEEG